MICMYNYILLHNHHVNLAVLSCLVIIQVLPKQTAKPGLASIDGFVQDYRMLNFIASVEHDDSPSCNMIYSIYFNIIYVMYNL